MQKRRGGSYSTANKGARIYQRQRNKATKRAVCTVGWLEVMQPVLKKEIYHEIYVILPYSQKCSSHLPHAKICGVTDNQSLLCSQQSSRMTSDIMGEALKVSPLNLTVFYEPQKKLRWSLERCGYGR